MTGALCLQQQQWRGDHASAIDALEEEFLGRESWESVKFTGERNP